ncbi:MAG: SPASM domain-containing protein, partial [Bdellovibrio sp.]
HLHFDTEFTWPSVDLPILGTKGTCYGLSSHFGILADGTVVPCCLDKEGKIPLGNVKDEKIEAILNSDRAQKILKGFKDNKLVENLCQRCQYITRFS